MQQPAAAESGVRFVLLKSVSRRKASDCLRELLQRNMRGNMQIVTQVAAKYNEQIGAAAVELARGSSATKACSTTRADREFSQDALVHFKYIEAAAGCQQFGEVCV